MQIIEFGTQRFSARADRTLWHQDSNTLFLSDLHLGKGAYFRQSGIPVPNGGETDDLNRLSDAVAETHASSVWILGDLFHHPPSITDAQMDRWMNQFIGLKVQFHVILGNHDRKGQPFAAALGFHIHPEPTLWQGIELAHHPDSGAKARIAGHIHPQIEFKSATDHLVYPCFAVTDRRLLLLPAFTAFSGGPRFQPKEASCYAIVGNEVLPPCN
ncbi:ligase-associated DNA damage response endonuclease PdeM [Litorivicinus sp.]|nr:ligase-associated DNA damage response endonuclease PdeM [Litorivicinus sp.]